MSVAMFCSRPKQ